mmetsp:Transcript_122888/g.352942  ORF Transcript_122888/g.352942 Transcript_122888/m.352942 type:complete len:234 (+) Transcript_122888:759-1460(+)
MLPPARAHLLRKERGLGQLLGLVPAGPALRRRQRQPMDMQQAWGDRAEHRQMGGGSVLRRSRRELHQHWLLQERWGDLLQEERLLRGMPRHMRRRRLVLRDGRGADARARGRGGDLAYPRLGLEAVLEAGDGLQGIGLLHRHGHAVLREGQVLRAVSTNMHAREEPHGPQRDMELQGARAPQLWLGREGLPINVLLLRAADRQLRGRSPAVADQEGDGYHPMRPFRFVHRGLE